MSDVSEKIEEAISTVDKVTMELVFAAPGNDNGLLPINCLAADLGEAVEDLALPENLAAAMKEGEDIVGEIFDGPGVFSDESIAKLNSWGTWLKQALEAHKDGRSLPEREDAPAAAAEAEPEEATGAPASTEEAESEAPDQEEPWLVLDIEADGELLVEFINESTEHLSNIEQGVLTMEETPDDEDTLNSIFRAFHTFKGGAGFLNLAPIKELAHELESLLDLARQGQLHIENTVINLILEGGDALKQFAELISEQLNGNNQGERIVVPTLELLKGIRCVLSNPSDPSRCVVGGAPAVVSYEEEAEEPEVHEDVASPEAAQGSGSPAGAKKSGTQKQGASGGASVKVDTSKLDALVDLVGEVVIAQSLVTLDPSIAELKSENVSRNMGQLRRITKELQRVAMSMRMVPIRGCFMKMKRLVRDVAAKTGKLVEFEVEGEETELDRNIVEAIGDPLIHMVRNSVDHGVETPDIRAAAGKTAKGSLKLSAYHQGGNIVISIKDDGAGLNKEKILAKAVEREIVAPDAQLTDKEIFELIFAPGFSTAEKVTEFSGRGVGMDVVRRNISKLRGKIEVQSELGKGSTFLIYLPLTLAIIDGLIVSVGDRRYILPTLSVRESFKPTKEMFCKVQGRGEMIDVRGRLIPMLRLYDFFNHEPDTREATEGIVVVVESGQDVRCVLVDRLLGKQEVVIKSLGEAFKSNKGLAGAAILGDGRVGLILDVNSLVRLKETSLEQSVA